MKVCLKGIKSFPVEGGEELVKGFCEFLQKQVPLTNDITIEFLDTRQGSMTTGVRYPGNKIQVLSASRLPIDVLRTLSHEWVHEYQMTILNRNKGKNIGGKNENEANAESGIIIKKFEKRFPNFEKLMYD
jgi:hypothetical protein